MNKKLFKNLEWGILICCLILLCIGIVALFSATHDSASQEYQKQIIWALVSIPIMIILVFIDYNLIAKISPVLYGIALITLVAVLFTVPINGAHSWFKISESFTIQPSEFSKVILIIFVAYILVKIQKQDKSEINRIWKLLIIGIISTIPMVLIAMQPDYGTVMAFVVSIAFMLFAAGIDKKYVIAVILLAAILIPLMYFFILPDHAKSRIDVFLNPELDPRGAGYNLIQSKLAIGSGKLFGMGILMGNQTQLGYLYPKATDFIFSVIGEEMGFIVAALIVIIYVVMITKAIYVAKTAKDDMRCIYSYRNCWTFHILYGRKYRNDSRTFANNRSTITICKLWRKLTNYKLYMYRFAFKYKCKTKKSNFFGLKAIISQTQGLYFRGNNMYLKKLKIGDVELDNNILLAPMAGITDLPFRTICKSYGAGAVCTEMVSAKAIMYGDEKTKLLLNTKGEKRPIIMQIFGSDVEAMKAAAKYLEKKADIIDINMGCPAPKVVKNGDGSKLLLDIDLATNIAKEVVKSVSKPVTVKIRKGWDDKHIVYEALGKNLEEVRSKSNNNSSAGQKKNTLAENVI